MSTAPVRRSLTDADIERLDFEITYAVGIYAAERIGRRSPVAEAAEFELPDGPPGPIEVDAVIGFAAEFFSSLGETRTAMAILQIAAIRCKTPMRMVDAILALSDCGPRPVGLAESARAAAVETIHGRPTAAADWAPPAAPDCKNELRAYSPLAGDWPPDDDQVEADADWVETDVVETPLAVGDPVRHALYRDAPVMEVVRIGGEDGWKAGKALCLFDSYGKTWRVWYPVVALARVPRPTIEPMAAESEGGPQ